MLARDGLAAAGGIAGLGANDEIGFAMDELHQSLAEHGVIVDEHDAEFLFGTRCGHRSPASQGARSVTRRAGNKRRS